MTAGITIDPWQSLRESDLDRVMDIAALLHPGYPERRCVFADRLRLFPAGCFRHSSGDGYAISHPACLGVVPPLDSLLEVLPARPEILYLHDVALLPQARGGGAVRRLLRQLMALAARLDLPQLGLCAIAGKESYWRHHGFAVQRLSPDRQAALSGYDPQAVYMTQAVRCDG